MSNANRPYLRAGAVAGYRPSRLAAHQVPHEAVRPLLHLPLSQAQRTFHPVVSLGETCRQGCRT